MLTDILIADPSEAEAIGRANGGHGASWPCLETKGADNTTLAALWDVLTDGAFGSSLAGDDLVLYMEDGGPWVIHLPDNFRDRLSDLSERQIPSVAASWAAHEKMSFEGVTAEDVAPFLRQLADHARTAVGAGKSLILWMSL